MLDNCAAVHMASDKVWIGRCKRIAEEAGFSESYPYLGVEDIARRVRKTPIQFLIAHYQVQESVLRDTVRAIRRHHERDVRFMPLIVFTRESNVSTLKHFLKMGFDDIITFPCAISHLVSRMSAQIERKLDYFEAGDYFGPDRRRLLEEEDDPGTRRDGGAFTHIVIQRNAGSGVKVLSQNQQSGRKAG